MFPSYIPPKSVKTSEPEDEHCVLQCTYTSYNICDTIPLDEPKEPYHIAIHNSNLFKYCLEAQ